MATPEAGSSKVPPETERPRFVPPTRRSIFNSRFISKIRYYAKLPYSTPLGFFLTAYVLAIGITNVGTYLWKGPGHPLNRFHWERMKARGELSPELLEKEKVLVAYFKDLYENPRETIPTLTMTTV